MGRRRVCRVDHDGTDRSSTRQQIGDLAAGAALQQASVFVVDQFQIVVQGNQDRRIEMLLNELSHP
jgi:predicted lipoprotein